MRRHLFIPILIAALVVGWAATSQAERTITDGLEVAFNANFAPHSLPRSEPAPVDVTVNGRIATTDGSHPPPLRWLEIEINRNGVISGEGLPVCRAPTLQSTSTQTALNRCGSALVGKGDFKAQVALGREVGSAGRILAFNSRRHGKPALLLHLFASVPVRFTLVVPLAIEKKAEGRFGTLLKARIPRIGGIVSVTQIGLKIGRRYSYKGERRSYASAACSAPKTLPGALFTFAKGRFRFEGHRTVAMSLSQDCFVR
jgi:hypothetical protein